MAAVRSTLKKIGAGQQVAGASVYRGLGLEALLNQTKEVIQASKTKQFGVFVM
jgi:hypothetical protein